MLHNKQISPSHFRPFDCYLNTLLLFLLDASLCFNYMARWTCVHNIKYKKKLMMIIGLKMKWRFKWDYISSQVSHKYGRDFRSMITSLTRCVYTLCWAMLCVSIKNFKNEKRKKVTTASSGKRQFEIPKLWTLFIAL